MLSNALIARIPSPLRFFSSITKKIDFSKLPKLQEEDLEETFVRGDGPGGQAVATTNNCVVLKHKPTKLFVKCHNSRSLPDNRKEARKLMVLKLDDFLNKEDSVENQRKRLERVKYNKLQSKSEKLRKRKMEFKKNLEANKSQALE